MRQDIFADLRTLLGPDRAIGDSLLPPAAFFATNAALGLEWASVLGLVVGAFVAAFRLVRGHRLLAAVYGLAAVVLSVVVALRTDNAAGYVLPTILMTAALAMLTVVTIVVRRPMVAWVSAFVRGWPMTWYWRDDVRPAYAHVSWYWVVFYVARVALVWAAYEAAGLSVLLVVRVLVSWPTMLPLVIVSYVRGNRRLHELGGPTVDEHRSGARGPFALQRGF